MVRYESPCGRAAARPDAHAHAHSRFALFRLSELYVRLKEEAMIRRDVSIDVRTSSCLKHCKRGPAAHVSVVLEGEGVVLEREVICVNVGAHGIGDLAVAYAMLE